MEVTHFMQLDGNRCCFQGVTDSLKRQTEVLLSPAKLVTFVHMHEKKFPLRFT